MSDGSDPVLDGASSGEPRSAESAQPPAPDFEAGRLAIANLATAVGLHLPHYAKVQSAYALAVLSTAESRLSLLAAQNQRLLICRENDGKEILRMDAATLEYANAAVLLRAETQRLRVSLEAAKADTDWPGGVSDGLTLPCRRCGVVPKFDCHVDGDFWRAVVPKDWRLDVVCLPCLDVMATEMGLDVAAALRSVQFTGIGKTVLLGPAYTHYYRKSPASPSVGGEESPG